MTPPELSAESLKSAYAEMERLKEEKAARDHWPDELYEFVTEAIGDPGSRRPDRLSYEETAALLRRKGLADYQSGGALSQAYRRERERREQAGQ